MNTGKGRDKFDKDIDDLYLQRKNSIQCPKVQFSEEAAKPALRIKEILSILFLGGVASFGIFAVINHFAHLSNQTGEQNNVTMVYVERIIVERSNKNHQALNMEKPQQVKIKPSLDRQPERNFELNADIEVRPQAAGAITLDSTKVQKIELSASKTEDQLLLPGFKVMPSLNRVLAPHQAGSVKLTYKISKEGKVGNIKVIQSNVSRDLEKSAKEALSQWRYSQQEIIDEELQVEFQFNN